VLQFIHVGEQFPITRRSHVAVDLGQQMIVNDQQLAFIVLLKLKFERRHSRLS